MRTTLAQWMVAALFAMSACGKETDTVVVVNVTAAPGLPAIHQLNVAVTSGPLMDTELFPSTVAGPLTFPASFALVVPRSRSGSVSIDIVATSALGSTVARGSGSTVLTPGKRANIDVVLAPSMAPSFDADVPDAITMVDTSVSDVSTGGTGGTGGMAGNGGVGGTGGTGGMPNTGGVVGTGGLANTGGTVGTGGMANTGGATTCPGTADLMRDPNHCGACGYECVGGRSCQAGRCTPAWLPTTTTNAPSPRTGHAAAWINGKMLVSGGITRTENSTNASFYYDPRTDAWSTAPGMQVARCGHIAASSGSRVYVHGGLSDCTQGGSTVSEVLEEFNPANNQWTIVNAANPAARRYSHAGAWLPTAEFMVFAGSDQSQASISSGGRFLPAGPSWSDASCSFAGCDNSWPALLMLDDQNVVTWGGFRERNGFRYNIYDRSWYAWSPPTGTPVKPLRYVNTGTRWLILNGNGQTECPSQVVVNIFDKAKGTWTVDNAPAPIGLETPANNNNAVWTGSELILWAGHCNRTQPGAVGVGGRYQPPAPTP